MVWLWYLALCTDLIGLVPGSPRSAAPARRPPQSPTAPSQPAAPDVAASEIHARCERPEGPSMSAATRRRALGSLAAAGANVAVSPSAAAEDPHPEWERELSQLRAGYARWLDDEATSVLYDQIVEVEAKIAHTPATPVRAGRADSGGDQRVGPREHALG